MRRLMLAGFVCACMLSAQPNPGTGSIEGHVVNSRTTAPVANYQDALHVVRRYKDQGANSLKQYLQPRRIVRQWIHMAADSEQMNATTCVNSPRIKRVPPTSSMHPAIPSGHEKGEIACMCAAEPGPMGGLNTPNSFWTPCEK